MTKEKNYVQIGSVLIGDSRHDEGTVWLRTLSSVPFLSPQERLQLATRLVQGTGYKVTADASQADAKAGA